MNSRPRGWLLFFMGLGYVFLYLPIISLVVYSFNASYGSAAWEGFSLKWYEALFNNQRLIEAALTSVQVATYSATLAVVLGTLAAAALVRIKRFKGRTLFSLLTAAPLVMPEVITGLSLLLLFVSFQDILGIYIHRGIGTVVIAHTTLCVAYVIIIVRTRLGDVDRSLEEAALDLGAKPLKVFLTVTLPIISPALLSSWLLAFALSMDDLVIASFTTGPGSSTLPMMIFASIRFNMTPEINALATIIISFVAVSVLLAGYLLHRRK